MQLIFDRYVLEECLRVPELEWYLHGSLSVHLQQNLVLTGNALFKGKQEIAVQYGSLLKGNPVPGHYPGGDPAVFQQIESEPVELGIADFQKIDRFRVADGKPEPDRVPDVAEIRAFLFQGLPVAGRHRFGGGEGAIRANAEVLNLRDIRCLSPLGRGCMA